MNKTRLDANDSDKVTVPELEGLKLKIAVDKLNLLGLKSKVLNSNSSLDSIVKSQETAAYSKVNKGDIVEITTGSVDDSMIRIPEIVGFKVEDAMEILEKYGIKNVDIKNSKKGRVVKTDPEENKLMDPKSYIKIYIEPEKSTEE